MAKRRIPERRGDLDRFLFRATGESPGPDEVVGIGVYDNLAAELDRLAALGALLGSSDDALEPDDLQGLAALLGDLEERMREILERALPKPGRSPARGRRS